MAIRTVLALPDKRLRIKAKPVENIDQTIHELINDMFETMYHKKGVGLAATQINLHHRIAVIDVSPEHNQPLCLINPELIASSGTLEMEEGCLSVPGAFAKISRAEQITIKALNEQGKSFELTADGLLARCILHEIDHLDGKLFVDYLSPLKRQMILKKLAKIRKNVKIT